MFDAAKRELLDILDPGISGAEAGRAFIAVEIARLERLAVRPHLLHAGILGFRSAHAVIDAQGKSVVGQHQFAENLDFHHFALFAAVRSRKVRRDIIGLFGIQYLRRLLHEYRLDPGRIVDALPDHGVNRGNEQRFGLLPFHRLCIPVAAQPRCPAARRELLAHRTEPGLLDRQSSHRQRHVGLMACGQARNGVVLEHIGRRRCGCKQRRKYCQYKHSSHLHL